MAVAAFVLAASPVAATNINPLRLAGDKLVEVSSWLGVANIHDALHDTLTNNVQPTDLVYVHTHTQVREVQAHDEAYGDNGWFGYAQAQNCSGALCTRFLILINTTAHPDYIPYTALEAQSLMCEEMGHVFGLAHKPGDLDSCMSQSWSLRRWDTHDRNLINGWY